MWMAATGRGGGEGGLKAVVEWWPKGGGGGMWRCRVCARKHIAKVVVVGAARSRALWPEPMPPSMGSGLSGVEARVYGGRGRRCMVMGQRRSARCASGGCRRLAPVATEARRQWRRWLRKVGPGNNERSERVTTGWSA